MPTEEQEAFYKRLKDAAKEVASWPEWKRVAARNAVNVFTTSGRCVSNPKLGKQ